MSQFTAERGRAKRAARRWATAQGHLLSAWPGIERKAFCDCGAFVYIEYHGDRRGWAYGSGRVVGARGEISQRCPLAGGVR